MFKALLLIISLSTICSASAKPIKKAVVRAQDSCHAHYKVYGLSPRQLDQVCSRQSYVSLYNCAQQNRSIGLSLAQSKAICAKLAVSDKYVPRRVHTSDGGQRRPASHPDSFLGSADFEIGTAASQ